MKLLEWAKGAKSILEIGSRFGYTLVDLAHGMEGNGTVVAVDWPEIGDWGSVGSEEVLKTNAKQLKKEGYDVYLFMGDSKNPEIIQWVRDKGPYDFIFIDGDHRYDGVKADWLVYGPMGKRTVFHDIREPTAGENKNLQVWKLWNEIEGHESFIAHDSKMGIGRYDR